MGMKLADKVRALADANRSTPMYREWGKICREIEDRAHDGHYDHRYAIEPTVPYFNSLQNRLVDQGFDVRYEDKTLYISWRKNEE